MAKRKKIGIVFRNYAHWTGGVYYILNLVNSINALPDGLKPELYIYTASLSDFSIVQKTGYPYLKYFNIYGYSGRYIHFFNRVTKKIIGKPLLVKYFSPKNISFIFPDASDKIFKKFKNVASWIPDFQEFYYPEFFSDEEVVSRKQAHLKIAENAKVIVFSSHDALNDFSSFFPSAKGKKKVLNFAVSNNNHNGCEWPELEKKFELKGKYFISPNQFWKHKNHKVVIDAARLLQQKGKKVKIVFTGKEEDYRNPDYVKELKALVSEYNLQESINFLGFIDKIDLVCLMKNAIAVIQPSLFEGWSTVVEDAKALGKFVIASSLKVHLEQLSANAVFFDANNAEQLAAYLEHYSESAPQTAPISYDENIRKFGSSFIDIINDFNISGK